MAFLPYIIAFGLTAIGTYFIAVRPWLASRAYWASFKPLTGTTVKATYSGNVSPGTVALALERAVNCLQIYGPWKHEDLLRGLNGVMIQVKDAEAWTQAIGGQRVGGETVGDVIVVGRDLSALCHELAHLAEAMVDVPPWADNDHVGWQARGIWRADAVYRGKG